MIVNSTFNAPTTQQQAPVVQTGERDSTDHPNVTDERDATDVQVGENDQTEVDDIQGDETDDVCSDDEPHAANCSALDSAFETSYSHFDPSKTWRLGSGRVVEDVLHSHYSEVRSSHVGTLVRDWVIDLGNKTMQAWFTRQEWVEIMDAVPRLQTPTPEFAKSLTRFCEVTTTGELRKVISTTSYLPQGVSYSNDVHFDWEWAEMAVLDFLRQCENQSETTFAANHLEQTFCYRYWYLLDKIFLSVPGVTFVRRESTCRASSLRKNQDRVETSTRQKIGRRFDGILRSFEDGSQEFVAVEAARRLIGGAEATKWMKDSRKVEKALRDMLGRLHDVVGHDWKIIPNLEVVGINTAGFDFQTCRMSHPKGHVCLLKWEATRRFPTSVSQLQELLLLLAHIVQIKGVVARTVKAVRGRLQAPSAAVLYDAIMAVGTDNSYSTLPCAANTP